MRQVAQMPDSVFTADPRPCDKDVNCCRSGYINASGIKTEGLEAILRYRRIYNF